MAGKPRVHELAKEFGVTSKELLNTLREQGEFVKSASSTLEVPVVRRLRQNFGGGEADKSGSAAKPGPAKPAAPRRTSLGTSRARFAAG